MRNPILADYSVLGYIGSFRKSDRSTFLKKQRHINTHKRANLHLSYLKARTSIAGLQFTFQMLLRPVECGVHCNNPVRR